MSTQKRRTKIHRGHRIVVLPLGAKWHAIVYAPQGAGILTSEIEGETAQDTMVRAMRFVDARLVQAPASDVG